MRISRFHFLGSCLAASAQPLPPAGFHCYIAGLSADSVTLAWGLTTGAGNTIGRNARSPGTATLRLGSHTVNTERAWFTIDGLAPDTSYPYSLSLNGQPVAAGTVRTWPSRSRQISFLVIGDWGNGSSAQRQLAVLMAEEIRARQSSDNPVRFVLSTGDNLYGSLLTKRNSGSKDSEWDRPFFSMYSDLLASVPFLAVPGNHDGNESENAADLDAYLDNFFFPGGGPRRWYQFSIGELAEFFALDSTKNQLSGAPSPVFTADGEQSRWLASSLHTPRLPWRIAFFHHPMFTAGPDHPPSLHLLRHWFEMFIEARVNAVFSGHEHNFQYSTRDAATREIQFVVSGAGGELRSGNIRSQMPSRHIAAWAPQHHYCRVELDPEEMRIWPVTLGPLRLVDAKGTPVTVPLRLPRAR